MKNILHNLRILGFILYLCHHWLEVLYWPSLILIALTSLGLLYYWRECSRSSNIWNIVIFLIAVLVMVGL